MKEIQDFFDAIWNTSDGWVCLVQETFDKKNWQETFFRWPRDREKLNQWVDERRLKPKNLYFTPAKYKRPSRLTEHFHHCDVTWADYDRGIPSPIFPDFTVMTSPGKFHAYWKLAEPIKNAEELQKRNQGYDGHDPGAKDASRVLRVPGSINGKHGFLSRPVQLGVVHYLPKQLQEICFGPTPDDRSGALWRVARSLAEAGAPRDEAHSTIVELDSDWGKFRDRADADERYQELLERAYSGLGTRMGSEPVPILGFADFLAYESGDISWVLEGFLYRGALGVVVGPPGSGKTQLTLRLCESLANRRDWLKWRNAGSKEKILYLSYEMGMAELKLFLTNMADINAPLLQEGLDIYAPGYSHDWLDANVQDALMLALANGEYTGVIVDSLGSVTPGSLKDDGDVKAILDFADRLRREFNVWVLFIHHIKKEQLSNTETRDMEAMFGSSYIGNRIRTSLMVRPHSEERPELIRVTMPKFTLGKKLEPFWIRRTELLNFEVTIADAIPPKLPLRRKAQSSREMLGEILFDDDEGGL